jgi:HEPN domain-containing protein
MPNLEKQLSYWREGSEEALRSVPVLEAASFWAEAFFWTHLAVEKALKAHVVSTTHQVPPLIHNLVRLAELARLPLTSEQLELCDELNRWQSLARYGVTTQQEIADDEARTLLERARSLRKWLIERL